MPAAATTPVTIPNAETIQDDDASKSVRFDSPQSQFAPDGMVKPLTGRQRVDDKTTNVLNLQNYRMGKFMREFSKIGFDGLQEVRQADGRTVWVADMAIDNQDHNFYLDQVEILNSVNLVRVQNDQQIQEMAAKYKIDPTQTYIDIDGVRYFTSMNIPMHFGTGTNNDAWINLGVFVLGDSVLAGAIATAIASLGADAFKDALKNLGSAVLKTVWALLKGVTKACYRFVTGFAGRLLAGETLEAATAAGRAAAGEAWAESVEGITSKTVWYSVAGVIIIVGVMLFIEFVLHRSYQNVYFYNLTDYDVELDFPYKDGGDFHNLPTNQIQARVQRQGPGGIDLGTWYNGVAYRYQSDSEFHGLGYTLRLKLKDPKTQAVAKTFSCLFDVPYAGNNSLYASTGEPTDFADYYSKHAGTRKDPQFTATDGKQEIIVTYDFLSGEHEDPETGNKLYLYNSLVIIRDVS